MQKKIKIPLIIGSGLLVWFLFFSSNENSIPKLTYTIEQFNEDGCEIYREIANFAAKRGDYPKALEYYQKSLACKPDNLAIYDQMGTVYEQSNNLDAALKTYFKAMSISPLFIEERFRRDLQLINTHDSNLDVFLKNKPAWTCQESLKNKTIFVYAEKGFGDTLQFCRFIPHLVECGATVVFKPQEQLVSLLKQSPLGAIIIDNAGLNNLILNNTHTNNPEINNTNINNTSNTKNFHIDYHVSLLQLPGLLNLGIKDCISNTKYISVNPELAQSFKTLINPKTFNIGIVWQGNPSGVNDKNRSVHLSYFYNLCRLPGVQIYSLQKYTGQQPKNNPLKNLPDDITIIDLDSHIKNFADTAAIIENLDLVISIDSAVAHLAGALQKNIWLLTPHISDWRWLDHYEKEQQIWYKNLRKLKQDGPGSWQPVFNKLVALVRQQTHVQLPCPA